MKRYSIMWQVGIVRKDKTSSSMFFKEKESAEEYVNTMIDACELKLASKTKMETMTMYHLKDRSRAYITVTQELLF